MAQVMTLVTQTIRTRVMMRVTYAHTTNSAHSIPTSFAPKPRRRSSRSLFSPYRGFG